jgi:hypothetical protein
MEYGWREVGGAVAATVALQFLIGRGKGGAGGAGEAGQALHLERRLQHAATGVLFVAVSALQVMPRAVETVTLLGCCAVFYVLHRLRLQSRAFQAFFEQHFSNIARPEEIAGRIPSSFYFLLSTAVCNVIFVPEGRF